MRKRAVGVIIKDNKILLIRRLKNGRQYFVFPGGSVETAETIEEAVVREIKEELGLDINIDKQLFQIENFCRQEYYFLIKKFSGVPTMGGPEKQRMNKDNQYSPVWIPLADIIKLNNLYPEKARLKIIST